MSGTAKGHDTHPAPLPSSAATIGAEEGFFAPDRSGAAAADRNRLDRKPASFGDLPAEAFDWLKSADAINSDPGCPAEFVPCLSLFGYPEWDAAYNEGEPARDRLVLAKATWGGTQHAVYALIWAVDKDSFAAIQADAMQMIEGARLPSGVLAGS